MRSQFNCGSCWSFASIAAFETAYLLKNGGGPASIDVSEQRLGNCTEATCSCGEGIHHLALWHIVDHDINEETVHPYSALKTNCVDEYRINNFFRGRRWGWVGDPVFGNTTNHKTKEAIFQYVLEDYSRYIVHWELCRTMRAEDVQRTVEQAMLKADLAEEQRPKLLSDNGACYVASELKQYLQTIGVKQVHGKLCHPQPQGKIERYHRSMKNVIKLDHNFCPEEINLALKNFVHYYNHHRYHESLDNVTLADVYFGKREGILKRREKIKQQTLKQRRRRYLLNKQLT